MDGRGSAPPVPAVPWRRADIPRGARVLAWQALLIASTCLLADVIVFVIATPAMPILLRVASILVIAAVDAALALPTRFSGWVAIGHAVAAIGLALVLRRTPDADVDLVGALIAAYRAGAWMGRGPSLAALGVLSAGALVSQLVAHPADVPAALIEVTKDACVPWLVGRYTSSRRAYISELRHRRENESRDAAAEVEKAVERVRTSVARDLHDVISHHVSAIGVHSGAARIKLGTKPGFADPDITDSLVAVETSSRAAMSDLRRMLDILHGDSDPAREPGLGNLDDLFDGVRRFGLDTRFTVSGTPRGLAGELDTALYRITQEMLTNALRHGEGTAVEVGLVFGETRIVLTARNRIAAPGTHDPGSSTGRGLSGIRSRIAPFGGTVSYGPDESGQHWETSISVATTAGETR